MIKIGLLGAGHLGKIHLKLLKNIPDFEIVGFYDSDSDVGKSVSEEYLVPYFSDYDSLLAQVDALDIVTPTISHFEYAKKAIREFKHIFIEKPLTQTPEEGKKLVMLAQEANIKAQVGHVERFNPAFLAIKDKCTKPMFIEGHRLAQWNPRGTDVSVVLDLMIHDIDLVISVVKSPVKRVLATGVPIISPTPDIANARIEFTNGCVANLTASRISLKNMRKMRLFQKDAYISVDFLEKKSEIINLIPPSTETAADQIRFDFEVGNQKKSLLYNQPTIESVNSIQLELEAFADSIKNDTEPTVTIEQAYQALLTAQMIIDKMPSYSL